MKIRLAKTAGFCMGVRRAVELVLEAANAGAKPLYTYGPLIHNPQIIQLLEEKGVSVVNDLQAEEPGTVLIRAHGVPPDVETSLRQKGFSVIDATCPRVVKVQTIIKKYANLGYNILIVGDEDHPEVKGLLGYSGGRGVVIDGKTVGIQNIEHLLSKSKHIALVAQTTQDERVFFKIAEDVSRSFPDCKIYNTICDSTRKRQNEVREMAKEIDAMIVIGGKESGNTRRLAQISEEAGTRTLHIESESELDPFFIQSSRSIGITAGASTPTWVISKLYRTVEGLVCGNRRGMRGALYEVLRLIILSNLYIFLAAGSVSLACAFLIGIMPSLVAAMTAAFYVFSMHTLNRFVGKEAMQYNDPDRAGFDEKNRKWLLTFGGCAGLAGLAGAYSLGAMPFIVLLIISACGLLYNVPIFPGKIKQITGIQKLSDIPGSKTFLIAIAWGVVSVLIQALACTEKGSASMIFAIASISILVFIRSAIFDILDIQGDRIVGQKT
ncbi:MAG: 4-hydroxy-3-methylbut-2-enyl diphosphate reductase, partial [Pseudomonadota bacterium]